MHMELRELDAVALEDVVGTECYEQALRYVRDDAIVQQVWVASQNALCGVVRGQRGGYYTPAVYFAATPVDSAGVRPRLEVSSAQCSCTARYGCEHAAALLMAAVTHPVPGMPGAPAQAGGAAAEDLLTDGARTRTAAWERSLESLLGTGSGVAEPVGLTRLQREAPLAMELSLVPGRGRPGDAPTRLTARLIQHGKAGGWTYGSLSWGKLDSYDYRGDYRPAHVRLLREMLALHRAGMHGSYYYPQADERFIELSAFESARLWPLLDEAYEAGLRMVHAGRRDPVSRHRDAELCLDVTAARARTTSPAVTTGTALTIEPVIRLEGDDERCIPVGFIGSEAHGVIYRQENDPGGLIRLARLARPAPASLQQLALDRGRLTVPAA